ncbi:rRNA pseudouridine synthase [Corynebacterium sp. sy017]|uniref:pseudouridine synthase n=1 Tax=Corynebacterium sp. sy017 TaxID=2499527 RepID=UPI001184E656|nr:pseudouridine synthase [Corynebacterium sp. SY003]MBP3087565.1 rRNA pseudouridine synthase [Corynebacterium sp. sy017]TSD92141.1 rRNA pseudouridine synthase [Corynebacterium sp. SY003]
MKHTARRDGTPEKKTRTSASHSQAKRPHRGQKAQSGSGTEQKRKSVQDLIISHAKPAKKQHVKRSELQSGSEQSSEGIRLQKVLAQAGVASRRHAEILIDAGRVEVNGNIVMKQGMRVHPNVDVIRVDGVRVNVNEEHRYFILNKPRGLHSTMHDEMGRPCIGDLVGERISAGQRLFHVGRLDADTEGLILLTNDGELANRLMHPRYKISKTYLATVQGEADRSLLTTLRRGVELDDGVAQADYAQIIDTHQGKSLIRVELHEGRKHIVRRMLKECGYPVLRLVRTKLHTVQLGEQTPGAFRALNNAELTSLYKAVDM